MLVPHHNRKHFFNETFFDVINTERKAYWLGFLYADGANCDKARNVSLSVSEIDAYILDCLKQDMGSDHKIYVKTSSGFKGKPIHMLLFCSVYLCNSLMKQGCIPRKSLTLKFPTTTQVPEHLHNHFIRGYFDGDGSFSFRVVKNKISAKGTVNIISSEDFCRKLKDILNKFLPIGGYINTHTCESGHKVFYLTLNGGNQVIQFMDWIYQDATIFLNRKREKYREFLISRNQTMSLRLKNTYQPHFVNF